MKLIHILNEKRNSEQIRSYDKVYGKILLDIFTLRSGVGTEYQYRGKKHRNDGKPARTWSSGTKEWWIDGKQHREDGPAVEYVNGKNLWYLSGKEITEEEWKKKVGK